MSTTDRSPDGPLAVYTVCPSGLMPIPHGRAPTFDQTIRTRGWWVNGVSRQDQTLFLSSGYWGVQKVQLQ